MIRAFSAPAGKTVAAEDGAVWEVSREGPGVVVLRRKDADSSVPSYRSDRYSFSPGFDERGFFSGPGYVDEASVYYGRNKVTGDAVSFTSDGGVRFVLRCCPEAKEVVISGSFNNWRTGEVFMKNTGRGVWEVELDLPPGKYLYKYIIDGRWAEDTRNDLREPDGTGGSNSVVFVYNTSMRLKGFSAARSIVLAGSFNGWRTDEFELKRINGGWGINLFLRNGTHTYKYLADGEWIPDPANPDRRPDGAGNINSVISVGTKYRFYLPGHSNAREVYLTGSFNAWNERETALKKTDSGWELHYALADGNYAYKFIADGKWLTDPFNPYKTGEGDYENSYISVGTNHLFETACCPQAETVIVTGSFNGWDTQNYKMFRHGDRHIFPMYLSPGKYTYRFIADGEWRDDLENPNREPNEFGGKNAVIRIAPGSRP